MAGRLQVKLPYQRDLNSVKIPNASLYFYDSGTDKLSTIYANSGLTVTLSNPVTADSNGDFVNIYLTASSLYKIVLKDGDGVTVWTADNDQPSLNTTIIPITNSGSSQVFWIEGATAVGDKLIFNSTNVPTLSEASISSNTAIENKTESSITIVSGQTYPLTDLDVTADPGSLAVNDKIYLTYSGVDAYYKIIGINTSGTTEEATLLSTLSRSGKSAISPDGQYVFSADNSYVDAAKLVGTTLTDISVSGSNTATGWEGVACFNDYAMSSHGSFGATYWSRSGDTFTKETATGLGSLVYGVKGMLNGDRIIYHSDTTLQCRSRSGSTFSTVSFSGGSTASARANYITKDGTYVVTTNTSTNTIYVYEWSGSQYNHIRTFATGFNVSPNTQYQLVASEDVKYILVSTTAGYKFMYWDGASYNITTTVSDPSIYISIVNSTYIVFKQDVYKINTSTNQLDFLEQYRGTQDDSVLSASSTSPYFVNDVCELYKIGESEDYTITLSSSIASEPDTGTKPTVPSSATTREYNAGTNISSIQIQTKFTGNKPTVDGATTSTSLVSDNSGIIAGDEIFLSTDSSTVNRYTAGTTTVVISGGKAVYTTDITAAGLSTAPTLLYTGNINSYSSVQSSSGSPSYTLDTESTYTLDGDDIEITYTARSVSGSYVQLKTDFDYVTSLNKFYAGLNT